MAAKTSFGKSPRKASSFIRSRNAKVVASIVMALYFAPDGPLREKILYVLLYASLWYVGLYILNWVIPDPPEEEKYSTESIWAAVSTRMKIEGLVALLTVLAGNTGAVLLLNYLPSSYSPLIYIGWTAMWPALYFLLRGRNWCS